MYHTVSLQSSPCLLDLFSRLQLQRIHIKLDLLLGQTDRPTVRINYGKFNICFVAAAIWNDLDENLKQLPLKSFKQKPKLNPIQAYV